MGSVQTEGNSGAGTDSCSWTAVFLPIASALNLRSIVNVFLTKTQLNEPEVLLLGIGLTGMCQKTGNRFSMPSQSLRNLPKSKEDPIDGRR